jgi:hypothetical protein
VTAPKLHIMLQLRRNCTHGMVIAPIGLAIILRFLAILAKIRSLHVQAR